MNRTRVQASRDGRRLFNNILLCLHNQMTTWPLRYPYNSQLNISRDVALRAFCATNDGVIYEFL